jgi:hypothetical protein
MFSELKINRDGTGKYHVNQFRIYFYPAGVQKKDLVRKMYVDFPRIFSGNTPYSEIGSWWKRWGKGYEAKNIPTGGLVKNGAVAKFDGGQYTKGPIIKFVFDQKALWGAVDILDFHDDWVGVVWSDESKGFAVQTLRNVALVRTAALASLGPVGAAGLGFETINDDHFLAGRRSWIIGTDPPALRSTYKMTLLEKKNEYVCAPLFYFETAAIERYSGMVYRLMGEHSFGGGKYDRGNEGVGLFPNFRSSIRHLWSVLLTNYVLANGFTMATASTPLYDGFGNDWDIIPILEDFKVFARESIFDSPEICLANGWVKDIVSRHPSLGEQLV